MKKINIIVIFILCAFTAVGAGISGVKNINSIKPEKIEVRKEKRESAEFYKSSEDKMYPLLGEIYAEDTDALYNAVEAYALYKAVDKPTLKALEKLYIITENGVDIEEGIKICRFWETTNCGEELIEKIAEYYNGEFSGRYWYEDIFNNITNNVHGVLENEDIEIYLETFSEEDIMEANVMSRKGVYTIQEILSLISDGKSWVEIAGDVYPSMNIKSERKYKDIEPGILSDAVYLANRTSKSVNYYLDTALESGSLDTAVNEYLRLTAEPAIRELKSKNLWDISSEDKQAVIKHNKSIEKELEKNGISVQKQKELKKRGYTNEKILEFAGKAVKEKKNIDRVIEEKEAEQQ